MRAYLSGPMSGLPDFNREAFEDGRAALEAMGHEVVDPVSEDVRVYGSWEKAIARPWQEHLMRDIATVPTCEAIVMLDGWEDSRGANLELRIAQTFGLSLWKLVIRVLKEGPRWALAPLTDTDVDGTIRPGDVAAPPALEATERSRSSTIVDRRDPATINASEAILRGRADEPVNVAFRVSPEFARSPGFRVAAGDLIADAIEGATRDPYDEAGRFVPYAEDSSRHVFGTGGIKDNRGKPPIDLLPSRPLVAVAEILAFGAVKYQPHNWRKGLPWPDTYSSLQRHLLAWNDGEDLDPETGKSHLAHALCQAMFLLDYVLTGVGQDTDNRWKTA